MTDPTFVFTDVETTGLNPDVHDMWELAIIRRAPNEKEIELVYQIRPDLSVADSTALKINRFHERFQVPESSEAIVINNGEIIPLEMEQLQYEIKRQLDKTILVGSNTQFDATFTRKLLGKPDPVPWHYRPVNAIELAVGKLLSQGRQVSMPWRSEEVSLALGVKPPSEEEAHTALGDARWARNVFDAVHQV